MVPRVKDNNPLARQRPFHWIAMKMRLVRAARKTYKFQNGSHLTNSRRRYMAEILLIRRKINQLMNLSDSWVSMIVYLILVARGHGQ